MKQHNSFRLQSASIFICLAVISSIISCVPGKCDPPNSGRGAVTVVTPIPPTAFQDCQYNSASLQTLTDIVKELSDGNNKWIVEFLVGGSCSSGKPWTLLLKKGDFTMTTINGQIAFTLTSIPVSNGPININAQFTTPCNSGTCFTTSNAPWRNVLAGNLKVDNPANGLTVAFNSSNKITEAFVRPGCQ